MANGEEERHDTRHPSKRNDRWQESTDAVNVTPTRVSPLFSGDSSTNDPQEEEEHQSNRFGTESWRESMITTCVNSRDPVDGDESETVRMRMDRDIREVPTEEM